MKAVRVAIPESQKSSLFRATEAEKVESAGIVANARDCGRERAPSTRSARSGFRQQAHACCAPQLRLGRRWFAPSSLRMAPTERVWLSSRATRGSDKIVRQNAICGPEVRHRHFGSSLFLGSR